MILLLFSNFRANFDVHLMEQKFLNVPPFLFENTFASRGYVHDFIISVVPGSAVEEKGEKKNRQVKRTEWESGEGNRGAALSPTLVQSTARLVALAKKNTHTHTHTQSA